VVSRVDTNFQTTKYRETFIVGLGA